MTITPDVPTSSRCTIPCRSEAPLVAILNPAAARCPTTVGPVQPGDGCTATPTGLLITTIDGSSWMIWMPSTSGGTTASGSVSTGKVTSIVAPASTRSLLAVPAPSRCTRPRAMRSAARRRRDRANGRGEDADHTLPSDGRHLHHPAVFQDCQDRAEPAAGKVDVFDRLAGLVEKLLEFEAKRFQASERAEGRCRREERRAGGWG